MGRSVGGQAAMIITVLLALMGHFQHSILTPAIGFTYEDTIPRSVASSILLVSRYQVVALFMLTKYSLDVLTALPTS